MASTVVVGVSGLTTQSQETKLALSDYVTAMLRGCTVRIGDDISGKQLRAAMPGLADVKLTVLGYAGTMCGFSATRGVCACTFQGILWCLFGVCVVQRRWRRRACV